MEMGREKANKLTSCKADKLKEMSLSDLNKKISNTSSNPYNDKEARINHEWEDQKGMMEKKETDNMNTEIAHLRLHKENLAGQISQLKKDIYKESRSANPNKSFLAEREKQLHKLQNDHLHIQGEVMKLQGRDSSAFRIRFHNPHYF